MIEVALLAFDGCFASGVCGIADVLMTANHVVNRQLGPSAPGFSWRFLSAGGAPVRASSGLSMGMQGALDERAYSLVFVPSVYYNGYGSFLAWLKSQRALVAWLEKQWRGGAVLATYGAGSYLLAESGLLNGREAATAWWLERRFRQRYPQVRLRHQRWLTDDDRLVCAGAGATYLYLVIRLVERFLSPEIAQSCVDALQIDMDQGLRSPIPQTELQHRREDPLVNSIRNLMRQKIDGELRVAELAERFGVSHSTLIRRFKLATGQSPQLYLQELRVRTAQQWLASSALSVEDVVARVGYRDVSSFTRLFQQRAGCAPGEYRRRVQTDSRRE